MFSFDFVPFFDLLLIHIIPFINNLIVMVNAVYGVNVNPHNMWSHSKSLNLTDASTWIQCKNVSFSDDWSVVLRGKSVEIIKFCICRANKWEMISIIENNSQKSTFIEWTTRCFGRDSKNKHIAAYKTPWTQSLWVSKIKYLRRP